MTLFWLRSVAYNYFFRCDTLSFMEKQMSVSRCFPQMMTVQQLDDKQNPEQTPSADDVYICGPSWTLVDPRVLTDVESMSVVSK